MGSFDMAQLGPQLRLQERFFVTRDKGEQAYELLVQRLQAAPDGQPLVLVFPPEQLIDASFADESIIRLAREIGDGQFDGRGILLQGLTEDSIKNISAAISLQGLKIVLLAVEPNGKWKCIGELEPSLEETLIMVGRRKCLTAPELADIKDLAINSASNRLKRLYDLRLVRREYEVSEKGLRYIYYFWQWEQERTDRVKKKQ